MRLDFERRYLLSRTTLRMGYAAASMRSWRKHDMHYQNAGKDGLAFDTKICRSPEQPRRSLELQ